MFRVSVILIAMLLLFNAIPVSFAQQSSVEAQARADANSNMSKVMWFMLGGVSSTAGCIYSRCQERQYYRNWCSQLKALRLPFPIFIS